MAYKFKIYRKRRPTKRKVAVRRPRRKAPSKGSIFIKRRVPLISVLASGTTPGLVTTTNTTVVKLGTAVASIAGSNYYDIPFAMELRLADLQNVSELTGIADKFCIYSAHLRFLSNPGTYFAGACLPFLELISDNDDAAAPTIAELNQKMGLRTRTFNRSGMTSTTIYPKPTPQVYDTVLAPSYIIPKGRTWLDCATSTVPHYGLKGVFRNMYIPGIAAAQTALQMDLTYSVGLKDLQ